MTTSRLLNSAEVADQAQPVDLLVDLGVLLDIGIRARDIRLGLIVVVIAHEIAHGVMREELFELGVELRRQGLVVRDNQSGPL
jgi:hypothetical protein